MSAVCPGGQLPVGIFISVTFINMSSPAHPGQKISPKDFAFENLLMDFVLLALYYFALGDLVRWQTSHFVFAGVILIILNIVTAAFGIVTFFSLYNYDHEIKRYSNLYSTFEGGVIGISALITFVAAFWWQVPTQAMNKIGGLEVYNGLTMLVYFITCLLVLAKSMDDKRYYKFSKSGAGRFISVILNGSFFFFSYAILISSLEIWHPAQLQYRFLGILCLVAFYLPFRIFLLLRPPFHRLEIVSMAASFVLMIVRLF